MTAFTEKDDNRRKAIIFISAIDILRTLVAGDRRMVIRGGPDALEFHHVFVDPSRDGFGIVVSSPELAEVAEGSAFPRLDVEITLQKTEGSIDPIRELIKEHGKLIEAGNHYAYFELAYTRQTEWMAWLCSAPKEVNPDRKVITQGQGRSAENACIDALVNMEIKKEFPNHENEIQEQA